MPKKAKSKPKKEAKKEEETTCRGIKNHKNVVLIVSVAIIVLLVVLFTNKPVPEFKETLTPIVEQVEEVQEAESEPEVIVQDKRYEITDNKVKVLKSECPNVEAGTLGSLEQQKELYDDCVVACEETGFARFTGNKYCDTNKDLICYCLEE